MATKQGNRIGLTFNAEDNERFMALAEFEGKKPATLANEIVKAYMKDRAADIDSIMTAKKNYQREIEGLRKAGKRQAAKSGGKFELTRQDGRKIEIALDSNGDIVWELRHRTEAYLLVVIDAETNEENVVGIFYDKQTAYDAAEGMKLGFVGADADGKNLTAAEYLEAEGKLDENEVDRLGGLTALEYLNQ